MRFIALLIAAVMLLSFVAFAQPVQYSTGVSGGAPEPAAPTSPEALGIQLPEPTESELAPPPQERTEQLLMADESAAYSAPMETRATYLGYSYPGWFKRWFFGDVPGWHILQYYCSGWSNYVYIYVYGPGSYWVSPYPGQGIQPIPPSSGYSTVILRSDWFQGYDVYLDGSYVGTEGAGGDPLDGRYTLRVPGNRWHTIVITGNGESYDESGTFLSGYTYRFTL